jgi:hypothetical protein
LGKLIFSIFRNLAAQLIFFFFPFAYMQVHYMGLLFQKFKPNMNSRLQLPKGYKKANLKAKPASYPRFTGACAIHCGKLQTCI